MHCARVVDNLVFPKSMNVFNVFKKTLNLLYTFKHYNLRLLDLSVFSLEKKSIEEQTGEVEWLQKRASSTQ